MKKEKELRDVARGSPKPIKSAWDEEDSKGLSKDALKSAGD